jgi:DNA-binding NarL/FixJ family response regulator
VTVRVLVVDGGPTLRDGAVTALAGLPGIEVVGEARDRNAAVERAGALRPDVVVVDQDLPGAECIEVTNEIVLRRPGIAVLVVTAPERDDEVFAAMRAGARGELRSGAGQADVASAVERAARGEILFGAGIAARALAWFTSGGERPQTPLPELTDREMEILTLAARGLTRPAITQRLFLSERALDDHVATVFMKLQVADRSAALARARTVDRDGRSG